MLFDDFDPNSPALTTWGVWDGQRFKTFASRGAALNSFGSERAAKLYEYIGGTGWLERAYKYPGRDPDVCDRCGDAGLAESYTGGHYSSRGVSPSESYQWKRKNGKITSPPELQHVCKPCLAFV